MVHDFYLLNEICTVYVGEGFSLPLYALVMSAAFGNGRLKPAATSDLPLMATL